MNKVAFAIYRESAYKPKPKVVYFTELDEHHRDEEIAKVMAGDILWDGYLRDDARKAQAKAVITGYLLENETFDATSFVRIVQPFLDAE